MITVLKLGGTIIDNENELAVFLKQLASLPGKIILVHGGGKLATALAEKTGLQPKMIDGRRVTDAETLKLVTMVYAGWINKSLVAQLQALGRNAIGLSGADGNLIPAEKRPAVPVDFGFVGDPLEEKVNAQLLLSLLENGLLPVIAPLTHDEKGQLLNTNADTVAATLAIALAKTEEVQLLFAFEKQGVLSNADDAGSVLKTLHPQQMETLVAAGKIHSGMLPKLKAGFAARRKNVKRVRIGSAFELEQLTGEDSPGTSLEL